MLADAGREAIPVRPVNIPEVIRRTEKLYRSLVNKSISYELDLKGQMPLIDVDRTQFRQIGLNLITNAAERIVHQHGGDIRVENQIGKGNTIETAFPVSPSNPRRRRLQKHPNLFKATV